MMCVYHHRQLGLESERVSIGILIDFDQSKLVRNAIFVNKRVSPTQKFIYPVLVVREDLICVNRVSLCKENILTYGFIYVCKLNGIQNLYISRIDDSQIANHFERLYGGYIVTVFTSTEVLALHENVLD